MIKMLRLKTKEELQADTVVAVIKCKDYRDYLSEDYWFCWDCKTLYEPGDDALIRISVKNDTEKMHCINECSIIKKLFLGKKMIKSLCLGELTSASLKYFEDNYIFDETGTGQ